MLLIVLAYVGGALTILSPCILPVLPFVFARADQPFMRSGLPLLTGMAVTFAVVATLAALGGGWVVEANQYGRWFAIALLAVFGLTLLLPRLADYLMRPLVSAGNRLSTFALGNGQQVRTGSSFLLGIATGLLWAPCAGPILGLVLTGAALHGASVGTTLLLIAYAVGAASSLAVALLIGGRVFAAMKSSLGAGEWIRRGIGAAMLCGVAAIALGLDTGVLTRVSTIDTGGLEQRLVNRLSRTSKPANAIAADSVAAQNVATLPVEGVLPTLDGAVQWLNSTPLTVQGLRSKVWSSVGNQYWPAFYFVDAQGQIRHHQFGEGGYARSEEVLQQLLADAGHPGAARIATGLPNARVAGAQAAADGNDLQSQETYIGYRRAENFASAGGETHDQPHKYAAPSQPSLNEWGLAGTWKIGAEYATLAQAPGRIVYRFHARDLHLVLGAEADSKPVRFRVSIDGTAPGDAHGTDVAPDGSGIVTGQRL